MKKTELVLKKVYRGWRIHAYLYDKEGTVKAKSCENDEALPAEIYKILWEKWKKENRPVAFFEENTIGYMGFGTEKKEFFLLGPTVFRKVTRKEVWDYCQRRKIPIVKGNVSYVPLKQMLSCLSTAYYLYTGQYIDESELESYIMDVDASEEYDDYKEKILWEEESNEPYGYDQESNYKKTVANGTMKIDDSVLMHGISEIDRIGLEAIQPTKKRYEYMVLIAIIYAGEACFEAGVPYYKRQELQETYMKKLAECKSEIEILQTYAEAVNKFSKTAGQYKERNNGGYVEQCKNYIGKNIRKKLTVETIAQALNVSENYLSRKFSEEEGISLKRYLLEERIRISENLLKNTDETIGTISDYLKFHSQSYFTKVFKEVNGITPAEYRKRNHLKK